MCCTARGSCKMRLSKLPLLLLLLLLQVEEQVEAEEKLLEQEVVKELQGVQSALKKAFAMFGSGK